MLFASLVTLSLATIGLASPLKRFEGISVSVSSPSSTVASVDDLELTASVTNGNAEAVKILKYNTVLDSGLTRSFTVKKDGADVAFSGVKLSVSIPDLDDTAFTVIPAGQTVSVTHKVSALYDFQSAGVGSFTFEPKAVFQVIDTAASFKGIQDFTKVEVVEAPSVTVKITSDVAKREHSHDRRAVSVCSNASRKSFIDASYSEGKSLASGAASYINAGTSTLFTAYYGASSRSTVASKFTAVANENSSSRTLSCTDTYGACTSGVIAYTVISTTNIYFCSIFFNEVASSSLCSGTTVASRNVRGGTTLHELTHAVASTDDVTYGCSADQALSDSNSVLNADNYNCFATQVYANAC